MTAAARAKPSVAFGTNSAMEFVWTTRTDIERFAADETAAGHAEAHRRIPAAAVRSLVRCAGLNTIGAGPNPTNRNASLAAST